MHHTEVFNLDTRLEIESWDSDPDLHAHLSTRAQALLLLVMEFFPSFQ